MRDRGDFGAKEKTTQQISLQFNHLSMLFNELGLLNDPDHIYVPVEGKMREKLRAVFMDMREAGRKQNCPPEKSMTWNEKA